MSIQYRSEHDSVGERSVPKDVYYGVQSLRAAENFPITGLAVHPEQINSIAEIKKASAITNLEIGLLDKRVADAIVRACDEIAAGRLHEAFIVDPIQGGAGTSLTMNANEVIANRAIELLGGEKGDYALVNPNDHVNYGQSTNDVFPSAGKLAVLKLLVRAQIQLERLSEALEAKAEEFDDVLKMGRTQMQDAVPIRLGQEFRAYSRVVRRDIARFERAKDEMRRLNMGGTAIGTGINADERYLRRIIPPAPAAASARSTCRPGRTAPPSCRGRSTPSSPRWSARWPSTSSETTSPSPWPPRRANWSSTPSSPSSSTT